MRVQEPNKQLQEEFNTAFYAYDKKLVAYASFKVNSRPVGEDLVQDTFIKTWNYLARRGKIENIKAFLYHVLNNLIVDQYRKYKTISLDSLIENGYEPSISNFDNTQNIFDEEKTFSLIKNLSPKYKKIIRMRYLQNLSLKEISRATGNSKNTIVVQVHRGLKKFKVLFGTPILKKALGS